MRKDTEKTFEGGCACGTVRFRMESAPMFVHCCHCTWCRRETGSAFATNALIEADRVVLLKGQPAIVPLPTASGRTQKVSRCPSCQVALWSNYAGAGDVLHFVRVGTLDEADRLPPDIHIYTTTRLPWVQTPPGVPCMDAYYDAADYWPPESLARREALRR